ncbi:flagellar hook-basal body protein [Metabacillus sp. GX 13764]|uniref:flagellar hook-basal body protein n=1 Tax=Metabacillus kandeliae TaxID=2900151 RepID=UPI001E3D39FB|nr:flagellar hook-basal body protein [Metabacillus kandeliae]MCD7034628.1 flagellar hook-basal body protein [Metabacillus kandeliae]
MLRTMINAGNTMGQLQQQLDAIGHNISNIDTEGYKRTDTSFAEMVRQQVDNQPDKKAETGRLTDYGIRMGAGANLTQNIVYTQGTIKTTDRKLDIALTKPGQFLKVEGDGKELYTRSGALYLSPLNDGTGNSMLVTSQGYRVLDENSLPIILDGSGDIKINQDGTIVASAGNSQLGIIQINKPQNLLPAGESLYSLNGNDPRSLTNLTGAGRQQIGVQQGALEMANVDLSKEMTDMTMAQRAYQLNAKSITLGDQMLGLINGIR